MCPFFPRSPCHLFFAALLTRSELQGAIWRNLSTPPSLVNSSLSPFVPLARLLSVSLVSSPPSSHHCVCPTNFWKDIEVLQTRGCGGGSSLGLFCLGFTPALPVSPHPSNRLFTRLKRLHLCSPTACFMSLLSEEEIKVTGCLPFLGWTEGETLRGDRVPGLFQRSDVCMW